MSTQSWMQQFHPSDPYAGFPADKYPLDLQGWGLSPIFEAVIDQLRPKTIIEVGTWKGASAIHMAGLMDQYKCQGEIVCVDTWLGGFESWVGDQQASKLPKSFGRHVLYEQFLANVIHRGQTKRIVPLPSDSVTAAKVVTAKAMPADAIYIDAGHTYEHVMADLRAWWPALRPGGVMFGDDYHVQWVGVIRAVHDFADEHRLSIRTDFPDKWYMQKTTKSS